MDQPLAPYSLKRSALTGQMARVSKDQLGNRHYPRKSLYHYFSPERAYFHDWLMMMGEI